MDPNTPENRERGNTAQVNNYESLFPFSDHLTTLDVFTTTWWSRVATAAIRGAHNILGREHAAWLLFVADDLAVIPTQGGIRETIPPRTSLLLVICFPLSWAEVLQWVGCELVLNEASLGLRASRAQWLEGWYSPLPARPDVRVPGRGGVARPIGPSWRLCTPSQPRHAPGSVKPLPLYVLIIVENLRRKIRQRRHCECGQVHSSWKARRIDALADDNGVGVGGWWPQTNEKGQVDTRTSPWFAVKVTLVECAMGFPA